MSIRPIAYSPAFAAMFVLGGATVFAQQSSSEGTAGKRQLGDALSQPAANDAVEQSQEFVHPADIAKNAFAAPPGAKALAQNNLWVDRKQQRVYLDGYIAMREGPLEMFACPVGTKEHESIVATLQTSSKVHAALLAVGARSGTPVAFLPKFVPATGQRIRVWVCYRDDAGKFKAIDARRWIQDMRTKEHLDEDWVFGGSSFWKDPSNGRDYYQADGGDMICVSNFATAMLDVPIASSADAAKLVYEPFTERIPSRGTPVRIVLVPIPLPKDRPDDGPKIDPNKPPTNEILTPADTKE